MSKTIFLFFVLCIFISCTTKSHIAVVKDMPTDTMQMGESSRFKIDDTTNIVEQIAADSIRRNNTSPRQIYHEQPKLSADSLAALLVLWDSIISNPLLGYEKVYTKNENGKQTMVYVQADAETVLLSPFDGSRKTSRALYWAGSVELPANRDMGSSSDVLFSWVDNMPTLTITYDKFIDAMDCLKELLAIKSNIKSKVRFVVEADGSISNAHIVESSIPQMDQLALIVSCYILRYTQPTHRNVPCRVVMDLWI